MKTSVKKFRVFVLLFTVLLSFALLISCQTGTKEDNSNNNNNNNDDIDAAANQDDGENTEQDTTERLYPELEPKDFGGYEFKFLTRTINNPDWLEWDHRDISAVEMSGDVINDAVYTRNSKIEDKYNIKIVEIVVEHPQVTSLTQKAVKAGDDTYDVIVPHITEVATLAQGGNFVDLFTVPNLDLSMPWWTQGCVRDLSIINKLFVIQGDLLIMDNDAMEAMIFNKAVLQDYALESPYDIVRRGEWTFEKLIEMGRGVSRDLNGDGEMYIKDDMF